MEAKKQDSRDASTRFQNRRSGNRLAINSRVSSFIGKRKRERERERERERDCRWIKKDFRVYIKPQGGYLKENRSCDKCTVVESEINEIAHRCRCACELPPSGPAVRPLALIVQNCSHPPYRSIFAYGSRLRMLGGVFWLRLDTHTAGERSTLGDA